MRPSAKRISAQLWLMLLLCSLCQTFGGAVSGIKCFMNIDSLSTLGAALRRRPVSEDQCCAADVQLSHTSLERVLSTQAFISLHLLLSWTNCSWIYWNSSWKCRTQTALERRQRWMVWDELWTIFSMNSSYPALRCRTVCFSTWGHWSTNHELKNCHREVCLPFHAEVLD